MNGLSALLGRLDNSPNRIALWTAIRGSLAIGVPLFVLPELGLGPASRFVVVGALATGIVDTCGPYGQRLRGMLANAVVSPLTLLLGALCGEVWWLAALAMAMVAALGGMMRALGPAAAPLGVTHAVAFLIGTQIPELRVFAPEMAAAYAAGGLWTILVSLIIWRARPYRRLEHEVASVWEELASLLESIRAAGAMDGAPARLERSLAARQRTVRETIERARVLLDEARGELSEQSASIDALLVLLRAASRIATVAAALADVVLRDAARKQPTELIQAIEAVERACRAVGALMTHGRGEIPLAACREAVRSLYAGVAVTEGTPRTARRRLAPLGLALRHLENAQDAAEALFGTRQRFRGLLPPLGRARPWRASLAALEAHVTFRSLILRHALRVALCTGVATAIMLRLQIPHGIWLPLTALVVAQPEFGGTLRRAIERTLGTLGGAIMAAALLGLLKGTFALDVAIVALGFGAFLLLRRRYGFAMVFITPLVILLLGLSEPDPWIDIRDRVIDTVSGGVLALIAAYVLWPQWERERLSARVAEALRANAAYMTQVFAMLSEGATMDSLVVARRSAETETGNAEAALQRMMSEPKNRRGRLGRWHALATHLRRLNRHVGALAAHIEETSVRSPEARPLAAALERGLEATAENIEGGKAARYEAPEADIVTVRRALASTASGDADDGVSLLIGRIASDVGALYAASVGR